MKKRIASLVLGLFMGVISLFSLSSCSTVKVDKDKLNSKPVLKIGDKVLTRGDVANGFYTFYQNNQVYFSYMSDSDAIVESFYQWLIVRELASSKAQESVYNKNSNPDGFIYYIEKDEKAVWDSVKEYFYSEVSSKEKPIYAANKDYKSEDDYPLWIRPEEDAEEDKTFEPFTPSKPEISEEDRAESKLREKLTEKQVKDRVQEIEDYIFEYVPDKNDKVDDSEDSDAVRVKIDETGYIVGARRQAFVNYKAELVASAKNDGTTTDRAVIFANEVYRVYEAYYNAKITELFQNYYVGEYLTNYNNNGDKTSLGDAAIAEAFINNYYKDKQQYSSEKEYIKAITSNGDEDLILYHYDGVYYYFSVQHVLLMFSDYLNDEVAKIEEKSSSTNSNYHGDVAETYRKKRNELAAKYKNAILSEIKTESDFGSIALFGDYYYFDEAQKNVYDEDKNIYGGYIKLSTHTYNEADNTITYNKNFGTYDEKDLKLMANEQDVLDCYENTYKYWVKVVDEYLAADEAARETIVSSHKDMEYVLKTCSEMKENNPDDADIMEKIYSKVSSLLFVELEWIYSADNLDNKLSNKIGYMISSYPDENGTWVVDFADGARELLEESKKTSVDTKTLTKSVVSDYGIHIIKLENIYTGDSVASGIENIIANNNGKVDYSNEEFVESVIELLKSNYVSTSSNETLYDYFYEKLYTNYVGSDSTTGTYFVSKEYEWLSSLYNSDAIVYLEKYTYDELLELLS